MTFDQSDHAASGPARPFVVRNGDAIDPRRSGRSLAKATAAATGGALGMLRSELDSGPAAPFHVHTREDEAWIVESGELEFFYTPDPVERDVRPSETERSEVTAGDVVFVPRGHGHSLTVTSDRAVVWTLLVPGGLEDFLLDRDAEGDDPITGVGERPADFGITIFDNP